MNADLLLAHELTEIAARIALPMWRRNPSVGVKVDGTPVTDVDLAVEEAMIQHLRRHRPSDAILSEEHGSYGDAERRWIIDPIDGTEAYIAGVEAWGTHVALEIGGQMAIGEISRPTRRTRCWALSGSGAWREQMGRPETRRRLHVSSTGRLREAKIGGFCSPDADPRRALTTQATWIDDHHSIVEALLTGEVDAVVDDGGQPWDIAPRVLLVAEAGGTFRDPHGGDRIDLGGGVYTTRRLEPDISAALVGARFCGPPSTVWRAARPAM